MRAVQLAKRAAEAEKRRLTLLALRQAMRGAYGIVALIFATFFILMLHIVALIALSEPVGPLWAGVIVLAADLMLAGLFALLAIRSKPSEAERVAERDRQVAVQALKADLAFSIVRSVAGQLAGRDKPARR